MGNDEKKGLENERGLSRRQWLRGAGAAGLSSLLLSSGPMAGIAEAAQTEGPTHEVVPTRPFGKTGVRVSCLSLGGMFDIPSNQLLLKQALDWGVTYWDTADCYEGGKSEEGIGKFFAKYPDARRKVFLVSKSDERGPDGMTKLLTRSLDRMKTDVIDLYFVHGINHISELNEATRRWAEQAKAQGKIKFFGFSTHKNMGDCMLAGAQLGWIDGIMMSYNYRIMHTDKMKAAVEACVKAGIGLTAMKTQGGGPIHTGTETELQLAGRFLKLGFTDKQAALKAVWETPHIASICSQMPNLTILMSNVAAALDKTRLSSEDLRLMEKYACETTSSYCAGCGQICESALGNAVWISDVMRCLMYYRSYGNPEQARAAFAELPESTAGRLLSLDFSEAERRCPQRMPIGRLMQEAAQVLV